VTPANRAPSAVLCYDEGPGVGLGHRSRCHALGAALGAAGFRVRFAPVDEHTALSDAADVVVVDSYRTRADDDRRYRGSIVVAFDDLDRGLAIDLLVLAAPGHEPRHGGAARRVRSGAAYVMVDPALAALEPAPITDPVHTVLVTTGAADAAGVGARIAAGIRRLLDDTVAIELVVGPWGAPEGVRGITAPDGLGARLSGADIVVTAGGITMLESLALGRPTIAVVTADNQRMQVSGVADAGAAWTASADTAATRTRSLAEDPAARRTLASAARALIDGDGPRRLAEEILALTGRLGTVDPVADRLVSG
jgi:UDP-2,4-diacetamido-2,4,6-trideoxy-beta-L-altropyranose hydrolase